MGSLKCRKNFSKCFLNLTGPHLKNTHFHIHALIHPYFHMLTHLKIYVQTFMTFTFMYPYIYELRIDAFGEQRNKVILLKEASE